MYKDRRREHAFTIVELVIVIAVIAILAGLTALGFRSWREGIAKSETQSDLKSAAAAMETARNFNNGYPTSLPPSFKAGSNVTVTHVSGDANNYCIEARSNTILSISYFINTSDGTKEPRRGDCANGEMPDLPSGTVYVQSFSAGEGQACTVMSDGLLRCSGTNSDGQLGNNSTTQSLSPVAVQTSGALSGKTVKSVASGYWHNCAVTTDGLGYCWGDAGYSGVDYLGRGVGTGVDSLVPASINMIDALAGKTIKSIYGGAEHICVIASDDKPYCWGFGANGELGNGSTADVTSPVAVTTSGVLSGKVIKSMALGYWHTCALSTDGLAYCWGSGGYGQFGNGGTAPSTVPVAAATTGAMAGKTVKSITAGEEHTCAVASDDLAYCWGENNFGQLGIGSTTNSTNPVAVSTSGVLSGKTIKSIAAGTNHTCVLASDNNVYCWGRNSLGQLGRGNTTQSTIPAAVVNTGVLAGKTVNTVFAKASRSCARTTEYKLYCWGDNANGAFGNGSSTISTSPVAAWQ